MQFFYLFALNLNANFNIKNIEIIVNKGLDVGAIYYDEDFNIFSDSKKLATKIFNDRINPDPNPDSPLITLKINDMFLDFGIRPINEKVIKVDFFTDLERWEKRIVGSEKCEVDVARYVYKILDFCESFDIYSLQGKEFCDDDDLIFEENKYFLNCLLDPDNDFSFKENIIRILYSGKMNRIEYFETIQNQNIRISDIKNFIEREYSHNKKLSILAFLDNGFVKITFEQSGSRINLHLDPVSMSLEKYSFYIKFLLKLLERHIIREVNGSYLNI